MASPARDRAFLDLVAPHLGRAYVVARARSLARAVLGAVDLELSLSSAVIVLDANGHAAALSPRANMFLEAHLGRGVEIGAALPKALTSFVRRGRMAAEEDLSGAPIELLLEGKATRLRACMIEGIEADEPDALVLDTEVAPLAPTRIKRLGLTERETEVVALLAAGCTNAEIAADLNVSPPTVKRHLENVYDKLDVRTRSGVIGHLLRT